MKTVQSVSKSKQVVKPVRSRPPPTAPSNANASSSAFKEAVHTALDVVLEVLDDRSDKTREYYRDTFQSKALVLDNAKAQQNASRKETKRRK